jgi:hypothetical protein
MGDAETLAGKRHILDTLTVIIERTKGEVSGKMQTLHGGYVLISSQQILPHLPTLSQAIPALCEWEVSPLVITYTHINPTQGHRLSVWMASGSSKRLLSP